MVAFVLVLVLLTSRLVKYIGEVASGDIAPELLFYLLAFRLPDILLMVLPVSLLFATLLVFGRMHLDNEVTVFATSGISINKLTFYAMASILLIGFTVGALSLLAAPWGLQKVDQLFTKNANRTGFETLRAGQFERLGTKGLTVYTETLSDDHQVMGDVFISQNSTANRPGFQIIAEQGHFEIEKASLSKYLILNDGFRYKGLPGMADYEITQFETLGIKIADPPAEIKNERLRGQSTALLLNLETPAEIAELEWRISMPLLVPIIALIGIPLSRVNPRQGRFYFLLPAIILYFAYLFLLSNMRSAIADDRISPWIGVWWVHLMFLALALLLLSNRHIKVYRYINSLRGIKNNAPRQSSSKH